MALDILYISSNRLTCMVTKYRKRQKFGMTKVWRIWRINAISPNFIHQNIKFFISVMAFKEIHQTLLVQIDFLANSSNFSYTKLSSFMVTGTGRVSIPLSV